MLHKLIRVKIILSISIILAACQTANIRLSKASKYNRFFLDDQQPASFFVNDSLKMGFHYYHHTGYVPTNLSQIYSKALSRILRKSGIRNADLLLLTNFPDIKSLQDNFIAYFIVKQNDWKRNRFELSNEDTTLLYSLNNNKKNTYLGMLINKPAFSVFIVANYSGINESNYQQLSQYFQELKSINFGEDYAKGFQDDANGFYQVKLKDGDSQRINYLRALRILEQNKTYYKDPNQEFVRMIYLQNTYGFLNKIDKLKSLNKYYKDTKNIDLSSSPIVKFNDSLSTVLKNRCLSSQWTNARDLVASRAGKTSVTIVNENHFDWRTRNFTESLLDTLYQQGYRTLAMEAIAQDDSLNLRTFPTFKTGFYTKEPSMSNLIRTAISKGYKIAYYEDYNTSDSLSKLYPQYPKRELYQTLNLKEVIEKNPGGKVLVHCGFSHLFEQQEKYGKKAWMAEILTKFTGIDPLTVDQYYFNSIDLPTSAFLGTSPLGFYALEQKSLKGINDKVFDQADIYVANNLPENYPLINFNPDQKRYKAYNLWDDIKDLNDGSLVTVSLYLLKETLKCQYPVPVFHFVRDRGADYGEHNLSKVYLPKGEYILELLSTSGSIDFKKSIEVK